MKEFKVPSLKKKDVEKMQGKPKPKQSDKRVSRVAFELGLHTPKGTQNLMRKYYPKKYIQHRFEDRWTKNVNYSITIGGRSVWKSSSEDIEDICNQIADPTHSSVMLRLEKDDVVALSLQRGEDLELLEDLTGNNKIMDLFKQTGAMKSISYKNVLLRHKDERHPKNNPTLMLSVNDPDAIRGAGTPNMVVRKISIDEFISETRKIRQIDLARKLKSIETTLRRKALRKGEEPPIMVLNANGWDDESAPALVVNSLIPNKDWVDYCYKDPFNNNIYSEYKQNYNYQLRDESTKSSFTWALGDLHVCRASWFINHIETKKPSVLKEALTELYKLNDMEDEADFYKVMEKYCDNKISSNKLMSWINSHATPTRNRTSEAKWLGATWPLPQDVVPAYPQEILNGYRCANRTWAQENFKIDKHVMGYDFDPAATVQKVSVFTSYHFKTGRFAIHVPPPHSITSKTLADGSHINSHEKFIYDSFKKATAIFPVSRVSLDDNFGTYTRFCNEVIKPDYPDVLFKKANKNTKNKTDRKTRTEMLSRLLQSCIIIFWEGNEKNLRDIAKIYLRGEQRYEDDKKYKHVIHWLNALEYALLEVATLHPDLMYKKDIR